MDEEQAQEWVLNHFHPQGLCCPECQAVAFISKLVQALAFDLSEKC